MRSVTRTLLVLAASIAAVTLTGVAPAAATAMTTASASTPLAARVTAITDEPWSSPAHPVECTSVGPRATCSPNEPGSAKAEECYKGVTYGDATISVCTTYSGNVDALKDAGGEKLEILLGCQFGDVMCITVESYSRAAASVITSGIVWVLSNTSFNSDSYLWTTAIGDWAWWQGAVLLVVLIAGIWALTEAAISGDRAQIIQAGIRFALAVPVSIASVWLIGNLVNVVDGMVEPLLSRGGDGEGLYETMENLVFGGGGGNMFLAGMVMTFLSLGIIVLVFVFSFRNFALAALIAIGPVAYMLFPTRFGRSWVVNYWAAVTALLLTTPLTLGLLMLVLRGFANVESLWSVQALPLGIGLIMIAFAPVAAFSLFSFAGAAAADNVGSRLGSGATRTAARVPTLAQNIARRSASLQTRSAAVRASGSTPPATRSRNTPPPSAPPTGSGNRTSTPRPTPTSAPSGRASSPTPSPATDPGSTSNRSAR